MIDNGKRRRLIVSGLFDGECGESAGTLSFIPNRHGKKAQDVRGGLLDDEPVVLTLVGTSGPFVSFRYRMPQ